MIAIVDYGLGNVLAFANVYKRLGIPAIIARAPSDLQSATRIVLPGVGAFDHAVERLDASGMREVLDTRVVRDGIPVLGVCVGMQLMANSSEEGTRGGLGWIPGVVRRFDESRLEQVPKLPHMGWNDVEPVRPTGLFKDLDADARFYFLHSYYFECGDSDSMLAVSHYGGSFASAVERNRIYGVQFHPEKSHRCGISLLRNFAEMS